jgi:hypothetical protein
MQHKEGYHQTDGFRIGMRNDALLMVSGDDRIPERAQTTRTGKMKQLRSNLSRAKGKLENNRMSHRK